MANFLYPSIKTKMLTDNFDWVNNPIVAILIAQSQYTPSVNHTTLLDVPHSARVAISAGLTGKVVNVNVVDADDYLFTYVSGPTVNAVILAVDTGNDASSSLICYLDQAVTGIPFAPAASPVQITWDNGPGKIFAL